MFDQPWASRFPSGASQRYTSGKPCASVVDYFNPRMLFAISAIWMCTLAYLYSIASFVN